MPWIIRGVAFSTELFLHLILPILQLVMSTQGIVAIRAANKQSRRADHGENSDIILTICIGLSL